MTPSQSQHPAFLSLQGGINFRDLGGQRTADGRRVRKGKLLRSGSLHMMTSDDLSYLDSLPLKRIIDYRDPDEARRNPDKVNSLACYFNIPANPKDNGIAAKATELDATILNSLNGEHFMHQLYRKLPFNNAAYRQLSQWLMTPFDGAMLQHCAVGKDRTGIGCALTLFALGCDYATVMEEYLLTRGMLTDVENMMLNTIGNSLNRQGKQSLADMLTVKESYLAAAYAAIYEHYGSVDAWLTGEFKLTPEVLFSLRERLLEN